MLDVVGPDALAVIANTGDDVEIYRAYVSPDPDLVTFWLADRIDDRGWGLAGDTFQVMDGLRELGGEVWFNLGDRDLAIGIERARALAAGQRLTEAQASITTALNVRAQVLPMSDNPVRTVVNAHGRWWPFQEFMIKARGEGPVDDVDFHGIRAAPATPEVLAAIDRAQAVVIGPSNPAISIAPILQTPGIEEALKRKPVVAVSPLVQGQVVKGPTDAFMQWMGRPLSSAGIAACYEGLIGGLVADDPDADGIPVQQVDVLMQTPEDRRRVAGRGTLVRADAGPAGSVITSMPTLAVLPIKTFEEAKRRLRHHLSPGERHALAEAMFADVLIALRRAVRVDGVIVVSADHVAQQIAAGYGAGVVEDLNRGHNPAATLGVGAALKAGADRALLVPGDCPALDPAELDIFLARTTPARSALVVPDRHGTGTNALLLTPPDALAPSFGPDSRKRHLAEAEAANIEAEAVELSSLALDVDTVEDLEALQERLANSHGGAARTRGMLNQLMRSRA